MRGASCNSEFSRLTWYFVKHFLLAYKEAVIIFNLPKKKKKKKYYLLADCVASYYSYRN